MQVVFTKADLDTCLSGAILGVTGRDLILHESDGALPEQLADPEVLCLEAGGSGQVERRNFDHHDTDLPLPPAATQAFLTAGRPAAYERLVELNELVDTGRPFSGSRFPNASHLMSGIRLVHLRDPSRQFLAGVEALREIAESSFEPFGPLPWLPDWRPYLAAKQRVLEQPAPCTVHSDTVEHHGLTIAFAETDAIGALSALYRHGADVVVVHSPHFGHPPVRKYTIGGNQVRVDGLLAPLNQRDPGWGGPAHGTIIGSPRRGSVLSFAEVRSLVESAAHLIRWTGVPEHARSS